MLGDARFSKVLVITAAMAVFCQMAISGAVLCVHSDGTQRVEGFAERVTCHASPAVAQNGAGDNYRASSDGCTDRLLPVEAVASRSDSVDFVLLALSPSFVAALPWTFSYPPDEVARQFALALRSPPVPLSQAAKVISSTVILT